MDLAFLSRADRMLGRSRAAPAIDYDVLVAMLAAHQAASATARAAAARAAGGRRLDAPQAALAELLAAGPRWTEARRAQRGSFHPGAAAAAVNRT